MFLNLINRAKDLFYDNRKSGLNANNVQGAIDKIADRTKFAVIEGEAQPRQTISEEYPEGFDRSNCVIVSTMMSGSQDGLYGIGINELYEGVQFVCAYGYVVVENAQTETCYYKILLYKYK